MAAQMSGEEFKKLCLMVLKPTGFMLAPLYSNIIILKGEEGKGNGHSSSGSAITQSKSATGILGIVITENSL